MATSDESMEEESNDSISLGCFELLEWLLKRFSLPYFYFLLFYDVDVSLDLAWEGEFLEMYS